MKNIITAMVIVLGSVLHAQDSSPKLTDKTLSFKVYLDYNLIETDSVYVKLYTIDGIFNSKQAGIKISNQFSTWVDPNMFCHMEFTHPGYNTVSLLINPDSVPNVINIFLERNKPDIILGKLKPVPHKNIYRYQKN